MPSIANAQTLVREFPYGEGRVLLAQVENVGGVVDSSVARGLAERGWLVDEAAAYQTVAATPSEQEVVQAAEADAVVFYSGSAVRSWRAGMGMKTPDVVIAIGESTARVARNLNIRVSSVAAQTTPSAVVAALVEVFEQQRP
jgi:uroporphyrinogen-III synthase